MTSHLTEEKLVAYVLNELDDAERALLEKEIETDPAIRQTIAELRQTVALCSEALQEDSSLSLTDAQRNSIRDSVRNTVVRNTVGGANVSPPTSGVRKISWFRRRRVFEGLVAAGILVFVAVAVVIQGNSAREKHNLNIRTDFTDDGSFIPLDGNGAQDYAFNGVWPFANATPAVPSGGYGGGGYSGGSGGGGYSGGSGGGVYLSDAGGGGTRRAEMASTEKDAYSYDINGDGVTESTTYFAGVNVGNSGFNPPQTPALGENVKVVEKSPSQPAEADGDPGRYLIKNADLKIETDNVVQISKIATDTVVSAGGYVSNTEETVDPLGGRHISLQLRVPSDALDATVAALEALGRVIIKHVGTEDITDQYVDTEARIRNLKATEERLIEHLRKTATMENTLKIEQELTRVREDLERKQGQLRVMTHRVRYSMIDLSLEEKPKAGPTMPVETFSSGKIASEATRSLVEHLRDLWATVIWVGVWSPAWGLIVIVVLLIGRRIMRRRARKNQAASTGN